MKFRVGQGVDVHAFADGDHVVLAIDVWQGAPAQTFQPPGMPAGVKAKLREFASSGSGTMAMRFSSAFAL